jgi:hypothetical protein
MFLLLNLFFKIEKLQRLNEFTDVLNHLLGRLEDSQIHLYLSKL